MPGPASTSSFATLTRPEYSPASSSITGEIMRQGPHHSAQKSMRTGTSDSTTSPWKFELVISTALATFDRPSFVISMLLAPENEAAPGKTTEAPVAFPPGDGTRLGGG